MVKNAYAAGNTQLTKMADKVNQLSGHVPDSAELPRVPISRARMR